ncbi:MAG: radical SAM protein [Oscillospiraceae bacterium]|nr:radical SAM protein [Oscillospiraceae bacterium]
MRYVEPIFRPGPTEGNSYLLQVTIGCAHNKCTFCSFFKNKPFRTRPLEEIKEDLVMARQVYRYDPPVFLIDGDATCYTMDKLRPILQEVRKTFPNSPHTNMYARFGDIYKRYSVEDLKEMKELNVKFLYMGMESGSDKVLSDIHKGVTQAEMLEAAARMNKAGMPFNGSVILGLGGITDSEEHIRESIKVINQMHPVSIGTTVLNLQPGTPLYEDYLAGRFELPTYRDILREERTLLEGIDADMPIEVWTGGFLPGDRFVVGQFPEDRNKVMKAISNRRITNMLLDQKLMIGGGL